MKRIALALLVLAPAFASAQAIYPLHVYATAINAKTGQDLKFMTSPEGVNYVGTCKRTSNDNVCDLAKNGTYETREGVKFRVKESQLYSADGDDRCGYVDGDTPKLSC